MSADVSEVDAILIETNKWEWSPKVVWLVLWSDGSVTWREGGSKETDGDT